MLPPAPGAVHVCSRSEEEEPVSRCCGDGGSRHLWCWLVRRVRRRCQACPGGEHDTTPYTAYFHLLFFLFPGSMLFHFLTFFSPQDKCLMRITKCWSYENWITLWLWLLLWRMTNRFSFIQTDYFCSVLPASGLWELLWPCDDFFVLPLVCPCPGSWPRGQLGSLPPQHAPHCVWSRWQTGQDLEDER